MAFSFMCTNMVDLFLSSFFQFFFHFGIFYSQLHKKCHWYNDMTYIYMYINLTEGLGIEKNKCINMCFLYG